MGQGSGGSGEALSGPGLCCPSCGCPISAIMSRNTYRSRFRNGKRKEVAQERRQCSHCDKEFTIRKEERSA